MEAYKSLPEGTLAELIDGIIYMSPAPSPFHQRVSREIFRTLDQFVIDHHLGEVFYAPVDVFLDEVANAVQPDLIFLMNGGEAKVLKDGIHGSPSLVVEIISPGNSKHDTIRKKSLYERFGVKEYWIVEPTSKEAIGYVLKNGVYHQLANEYGQLRSTILNNVFVF